MVSLKDKPCRASCSLLVLVSSLTAPCCSVADTTPRSKCGIVAGVVSGSEKERKDKGGVSDLAVVVTNRVGQD